MITLTVIIELIAWTKHIGRNYLDNSTSLHFVTSKKKIKQLRKYNLCLYFVFMLRFDSSSVISFLPFFTIRATTALLTKWNRFYSTRKRILYVRNMLSWTFSVTLNWLCIRGLHWYPFQQRLHIVNRLIDAMIELQFSHEILNCRSAYTCIFKRVGMAYDCAVLVITRSRYTFEWDEAPYYME